MIKKVQEGNVDGIEELLNQGFNIDAVGADKRTAVHVSAFYGDRSMIEFLVDHNANVKTCDVNGNTPLHAAIEGAVYQSETAMKSFAKTIKFLVQLEVNINALNTGHNTPLLYAVYYNLPTLVEVLIQQKADVNILQKQYDLLWYISQI